MQGYAVHIQGRLMIYFGENWHSRSSNPEETAQAAGCNRKW